MTDATRLKATVYVGGLDNGVNERVLTDAFLPFGEVVDVSLPKPEAPSSTDPHRGFGYIEFESLEDAREAIDNMDQSELFGRVLKVAPAKPQKEGNEGLGSRVAIWEQEGWLARNAVSEEDRDTARKVEGDVSNEGEVAKNHKSNLIELDLAGPLPE